jgi:uncharacterized protein YlxW (UPF0749 family)
MMADRDGAAQAEGLLEQIADTALDDDYYVVRAGPYSQSREFNTVLTGAVLAAFALLVATAAFQTRNDRPATEQERATLIGDIASRKESLAGRESAAKKLRAEVEDLSTSVSRFDPEFETLRLQAADRGATGPGITVVVAPSSDESPEGSISDHDIQVLVNTLWYAGAEAIAVNDKRIGTLTSIRTAGGVIKVNYRTIAPPYVIKAIGDADALQDRFAGTDTGESWLRRRNGAGVRFSVTPSSNLTVDAAATDRLKVRKATVIKGDE